MYPPLWQDYGEEAILQRMKISKLPKPSLLNKCVIRHFNFDFIDNALRKNVSQRQQTLDELLEDIAEFLFDKTTFEKTILIEGASLNQNVKNTKTNIFCSTCLVDPNIKVSNGDANIIPSVHLEKDGKSLRIYDFASTSISFCKSNDTQRSDCRSTQSFSPKTQPQKMQARYMGSTQDDFFGKLKK